MVETTRALVRHKGVVHSKRRCIVSHVRSSSLIVAGPSGPELPISDIRAHIHSTLEINIFIYLFLCVHNIMTCPLVDLELCGQTRSSKEFHELTVARSFLVLQKSPRYEPASFKSAVSKKSRSYFRNPRARS